MRRKVALLKWKEVGGIRKCRGRLQKFYTDPVSGKCTWNFFYVITKICYFSIEIFLYLMKRYRAVNAASRLSTPATTKLVIYYVAVSVVSRRQFAQCKRSLRMNKFSSFSFHYYSREPLNDGKALMLSLLHTFACKAYVLFLN